MLRFQGMLAVLFLALLLPAGMAFAQPPTAADADFNGNGEVEFNDFLLFVEKFNTRQGDDEYEARYDFDGDGAVSFADFLSFVGVFGQTVPAPALGLTEIVPAEGMPGELIDLVGQFDANTAYQVKFGTVLLPVFAQSAERITAMVPVLESGSVQVRVVGATGWESDPKSFRVLELPEPRMNAEELQQTVADVGEGIGNALAPVIEAGVIPNSADAALFNQEMAKLNAAWGVLGERIAALPPEDAALLVHLLDNSGALGILEGLGQIDLSASKVVADDRFLGHEALFMLDLLSFVLGNTGSLLSTTTLVAVFIPGGQPVAAITGAITAIIDIAKIAIDSLIPTDLQSLTVEIVPTPVPADGTSDVNFFGDFGTESNIVGGPTGGVIGLGLKAILINKIPFLRNMKSVKSMEAKADEIAGYASGILVNIGMDQLDFLEATALEPVSKVPLNMLLYRPTLRNMINRLPPKLAEEVIDFIVKKIPILASHIDSPLLGFEPVKIEDKNVAEYNYEESQLKGNKAGKTQLKAQAIRFVEWDQPLKYFVSFWGWETVGPEYEHFEVTNAGDRATLVALFDVTGGDEWTNNTNWLSDKPLRDWQGVTTNTQGRVTVLALHENQLSGRISPALGNLRYLTVLTLHENRLSEGIPEQLGNLTNLQLLALSSNDLSGLIPSALGKLRNLTVLALHENRLSGRIPPALGNLRYLTRLSLYDNYLSGPIPEALGNLTNLQLLALSRNQLTGPIPEALGNLTNLTTLNLHENQLTGPIPKELGNLTALEKLTLKGNDLCVPAGFPRGNVYNLIQEQDLPNCLTAADRDVLVSLYENTNPGLTDPNERGWTNSLNWRSNNPLEDWYGVSTNAQGRVDSLNLSDNLLRGTIPEELGSLTYLTYLDLRRNQLRGAIPSSLGNLTQLQILALHENLLSGQIPAALGNLTELTYLTLHENRLTGSIPTTLGNLTNLTTELNLSRNQLTGTIPDSLGNLTKLKKLYLFDNQLTGTIPAALGNLTNLTELHLQDNELRGPIPLTFGNLTNLEHLGLGNNANLCLPDSLQTWAASRQLVDAQNLPVCSPRTDLIVARSIHRLTNSAGNDWHPSWSPDGGHIAFMSDRDGDFEIYVMGSDGSNPRRLTNSAGDDAWSDESLVVSRWWAYRLHFLPRWRLWDLRDRLGWE